MGDHWQALLDNYRANSEEDQRVIDWIAVLSAEAK